MRVCERDDDDGGTRGGRERDSSFSRKEGRKGGERNFANFSLAQSDCIGGAVWIGSFSAQTEKKLRSLKISCDKNLCVGFKLGHAVRCYEQDICRRMQGHNLW